jgi:hypothetical protein
MHAPITGISRESKLRTAFFGRLRMPGWQIGRRARLRIAKSSISERRFLFQGEPIYEGKTGFLCEIVAVANGE